MADIQSATADIRPGKKKDTKKDRRRNYRAKILRPALLSLHRAAIIMHRNLLQQEVN